MVGENIYAIYPSNDHAFIDVRESKDRSNGERFNVQRLLPNWRSRDYRSDSPGKQPLPAPDATILIGGALAIKENLKNSLFPRSSDKIELLPIRVNKENWLVVNCLEAESRYDSEASIMYRGLDGTIFMVVHLVLEAAEHRRSEIFVIEDSNRATIFACQSFVDRFRELNLRGLTFRAVGKFKLDMSGQ